MSSTSIRIPRSTYRVQFQRTFDLRQGHELVEYLSRLGIGACYASPLLASRPSSPHGYDICDHGRLDDDLGDAAAFDAFSADLARRGMGLLLDFVPNHMVADPRCNRWWRDVLQNGLRSRFARYFDIDWLPAKPELRGKVLLPVLGDLYGLVLERGELRLAEEDGAPVMRYFDHSFPLDPESAKRIADGQGGTAAAVEAYNGKSGDPSSFDRLHELLERQAYRLSYWKTAFHEINYRRFFDINDLVGLRVEEPEVFAAIYSLVLSWIRAGKVTGLRLDHIDGLFDPRAHLERLREAGGPIYVVVEKILSDDERLPASWPVQGTTGYDFLNDVNGLFVDPRGAEVLRSFYERFTGRGIPFPIETYVAKKLILTTSMASELNVLAQALNRISERDRRWRDFTLDSLRDALREVVACFPVYRTYFDAGEPSPADRATAARAIGRARRRNPTMDGAIFDFVQAAIVPAEEGATAEQERRTFAMKFQQYTGPVQAKGLEDTAFYRHGVLVSVNEVGGDPRRLGRSVAEFHESNRRRADDWPNGMLATATHDTKRGEDARVRIDVISEISRDWRLAVSRWSDLNEANRTPLDGDPAPSRNDEYLFYQTLIGAWPAETSAAPTRDLVRRLGQYMIKAAKEAKLHTSWISDNRAYDEALVAFVERSLGGPTAEAFLAAFRPLHARVARAGMVNSLAQLVLKLTSPGVPDFYQGTELWDLSLVDPDNRRPVDYAERRRIIEALEPHLEAAAADRRELVAELLDHWPDGRIKMWVTACGLRLRNRRPELFRTGAYRALEVGGERAAHGVAFARASGDEAVIAVVPRLTTRLTNAHHPLPLGKPSWGDTHVVLPPDLPSARWRNVLTGETATGFRLPASAEDTRSLGLAEVLATSPVALLESA